jgi:hypothetical protein
LATDPVNKEKIGIIKIPNRATAAMTSIKLKPSSLPQRQEYIAPIPSDK